MNRKQLTGLFFIVFLFAPLTVFCDELGNLLSSKDWRDLEKGISIIEQNFEKYKNNEYIKEKLKSRFILESKWQRNPSKFRINWGEGYGETLVYLVKTIKKMKIEGTEIYYLNWVRNLPNLKKDFTVFLDLEKPNDLSTFNIIVARINAKDKYSKENKRFFLETICHYAKVSKKIPQNKKTIVKNQMLKMLDSKNHYDRLYASKCSENFIEDKKVLERIQNVLLTDPYYRWTHKKATKKYDVRQAAKEVLKVDCPTEITKEQSNDHLCSEVDLECVNWIKGSKWLCKKWLKL